VAFSITTLSSQRSLNQAPATGNTVQPTLPCWVFQTAGSISISGSVFVLLFVVCCFYVSSLSS
ncbi:MAG: hypothetical protein PHR83_18400, partial [Paludibacter sp.]|nr:hypothetical protein [Paludibacter sp.]